MYGHRYGTRLAAVRRNTGASLSRRSYPVRWWIVRCLVLCGLVFAIIPPCRSSATQESAYVYEEAQIVYLSNMERRTHGLPPLRWNRQLTEAARWFARDSTENRSGDYCGHEDTQGHFPDWRARAFGYHGLAGAENAFCGSIDPQTAVTGWMNSSGHRANLLDPDVREMGLGAAVRTRDQYGYVAQMFGHDPVYPPVILNNEALTTTTPQVNLYIYNSKSSSTFAGMGPITDMMVSNEPSFANADWEPYTAEKSWTVPAGEGWRTVYVKLRDHLARTVTVQDTIYLGATVPHNQLGFAQMSSTQDQVELINLDSGGLPSMQLSAGWLADDQAETFEVLSGNGVQVTDAAAWGGTAVQLLPGEGESAAWIWTTEFVKDVPLVAYVRLQVSDTAERGEVARFSIAAGGHTYGPLIVQGHDVAAADTYQEFALPFTFHTNADEPFLQLQIARTGAATVTFDAVSLFTAPQPVTTATTWRIPGGNYRGQGVWVRFTDGDARFSPMSEATVRQPAPPEVPTALPTTTPTTTPTTAPTGVPTAPTPTAPTTTPTGVPTAPTPTAPPTAGEPTDTPGYPPPVTDGPPPTNGTFADVSFRQVWERTDLPVADNAPGLGARSWIWGPQPATGRTYEPYAESPGGQRLVQYFDKSRMEITDPDAARNLWYVTNGLLVIELIEGKRQIGHTSFADATSSNQAVAGDPEAVNPHAPTYRSFRNVAYPVTSARTPQRTGEVVTAVLHKDGTTSDNPDLARYNVTLAAYDDQLGHNIPQVFTTFFAQHGLVYEQGRYVQGSIIDWVFVVGLPISEPYWARVKVGGVEKDVLMQAFQRRVLTYTPANDPAWRVEMGNVGQHYLRWRYQQ